VTLIERLIIVVIVGLLIAVAGANYRAYKERPESHKLIIPFNRR